MTNPGAPGTNPYAQAEQGDWPPVPPPVTQPYTGYPPPPAPQPPKRPWVARHKILTAVLAIAGLFVVMGGIGAAVGGDTSTTGSDVANSAAANTMPPIPSEQAAANSAAANASPAPPAPTADDPTTAPATAQAKPKPPAQPELTISQEQAVGAAKDYLDTSAFSRAGLIEQLSSAYGSGFSKADATFAVDYLQVNWKEQAVLAAKEYLQTMHFSRAGLIQQLSSAYGSKFTRVEATYAADQVGL